MFRLSPGLNTQGRWNQSVSMARRRQGPSWRIDRRGSRYPGSHIAATVPCRPGISRSAITDGIKPLP